LKRNLLKVRKIKDHLKITDKRTIIPPKITKRNQKIPRVVDFFCIFENIFVSFWEILVIFEEKMGRNLRGFLLMNPKTPF
jgi:hypothetical protein